MSAVLDALDPAVAALARPAPPPTFAAPMKATLTDDPFDDEEWIYERKFDGVRILVLRSGGKVRLLSRNDTDRSVTYFEVREAFQSMEAPDLAVDGEVVAFRGKVASFRRLQERMQTVDAAKARRLAEEIPVHFYAFDLLHLDGQDVTALPLRARKALLRSAIGSTGAVRSTPYRNGRGTAWLAESCAAGWEGLIAKKADSPYVHARSTDWLKLKCQQRQEFVVGGFTDPRGGRTGFGALLVGVHDRDGLRYAGKVGTGFDADLLDSLRRRMDRMERKTAPFERDDDLPREGAHWVTPRLVAEVRFTEWTTGGKLRHPAFLGLRHDKDAEEVVRERPLARGGTTGTGYVS